MALESNGEPLDEKVESSRHPRIGESFLRMEEEDSFRSLPQGEPDIM